MSGYMLRARIIARMTERRVNDAQLARLLHWPLYDVRTRILGGRGALTVTEVASLARVLDVPIEDLTLGEWYGCGACGAVAPQPMHHPGCTEADREGAEELLPAVPR